MPRRLDCRARRSREFACGIAAASALNGLMSMVISPVIVITSRSALVMFASSISAPHAHGGLGVGA
jgi:hypothetical protein